MAVVGTLKLHSALVLAQAGSAGFQLLTKVGLLDNGMNRFAYPVYRNVIASLLLAPMAYSIERQIRHPLTWTLMFQFFLLGFTGIFLNQSLYLKGLECTNPTFASTIQNFTPGLVFLMAVLFRLEEVRLRRTDGQAKILGATLGLIGALMMSLYKGPSLFDNLKNVSPHAFNTKSLASFPSERNAHLSSPNGCWHLGAFCVICNTSAYALWMIIQIPVLKKYPARLHVLFFSTCWGLTQLVLFAFTQIAEPSQWKITSRSGVLAVIYAGLVNSGISYSLQSWCIQNGGPVLVAVYQPLQTVMIGVLAVPLFGDRLSLGSVVGGLLIISGLYLVTWGQAEQRRLAALDQLEESKAEPNRKVGETFCDSISEPLLKSSSLLLKESAELEA